MKEGDTIESTRMDRLLDIRCDMQWEITDISQLREIVVAVERRFEDSKFKADWVNGPDDDALKQIFQNYDEYHGIPHDDAK